MPRICFLLVLLILSGCGREDLSSSAVASDRVYTVDDFLAEPELRKKFMSLCASDPGRTESHPNCVNVISAERIASAGTTIPRIIP